MTKTIKCVINANYIMYAEMKQVNVGAFCWLVNCTICLASEN